VPEGKALADPPLLRLEGEACHAYLSMLLHLNTAASAPLQAAADVEKRLLQLSIGNLRCFQVSHFPPHDYSASVWSSTIYCTSPLGMH